MVITRQLVAYITVNNTWTQLTEGVGGSLYTVPTSGSNPRGDVKLIRAINFSSNSATAYFGFTSGSLGPTTQAYEVWNHPIIPANDIYNDDSVHIVRAGEKLWAKVNDSSGSPFMNFRTSLMECS